MASASQLPLAVTNDGDSSGCSTISGGHRARRGALTAIAILTVGLTTRAAWANDWGTAGLDLAHTRLSSEHSGAMFADGRWAASAPGWTIASPVVEDGVLVTVNLDGVVSALRADTGELVWRVSLQSTVQGTPALARGRVFVPTVSNVLYALSLTDGAVLWTRDVGGMTLSSPTPLDGDIVVAPGFPQMNVVRLSGETGELVWQSPAMWQFSNTAPAVGDGIVVAGSQEGRYYAFDAATGDLHWEYIADGIVHLAAPIILGGRVYMAGGDQSNRVHSVDAATGTAAPGWPIDLPTPAPDIAGTRQGGWRAVSSFAAAGGLLLMQTRLDDALGARANGPFNWLSREMVVALNPSSGSLVWQRALARKEFADVNDVPKFFVCPTPAAYGTVSRGPMVAVASSLDPIIAVLDVASGNESARHSVAGAALASPVVANGRLFTTSMKGMTEGLASSVNHAPAAPVAANYAAPIDGANPTLSWSAAVDCDGDVASYELRIDADGELLGGWQHQTFVDMGMTSTRIAAPLVAGVTYTFAVRARDQHGAMSPWSAPATFAITAPTSTDPRDVVVPPAGMMGMLVPGGVSPPPVPTTDPARTAGQPAGSPPDQAAGQGIDGAGCSISGQTGIGCAALFVFGSVVVGRCRRRTRSA